MGSNLDSFERIGWALDCLASRKSAGPAAGTVVKSGRPGTMFLRNGESPSAGIAVVCTLDAARDIHGIFAALDGVTSGNGTGLCPTESLNLYAGAFPNGVRVFDVGEDVPEHGFRAMDFDAWAELEKDAGHLDPRIVIDESGISFSCDDPDGNRLEVSWLANDFLDAVRNAVEAAGAFPPSRGLLEARLTAIS